VAGRRLTCAEGAGRVRFRSETAFYRAREKSALRLSWLGVRDGIRTLDRQHG
jgi:hypothetical protein